MKLISSNPLANSGAAKEPVVNSIIVRAPGCCLVFVTLRNAEKEEELRYVKY